MVLQVHPIQTDRMASIMRRIYGSKARQARVLTDLSGPFNTVVQEVVNRLAKDAEDREVAIHAELSPEPARARRSRRRIP